MAGISTCIFSQDANSLFKSYNEKSCQFECRLKFAVRRVGCIPWDYPVPRDDGFDYRYETWAMCDYRYETWALCDYR